MHEPTPRQKRATAALIAKAATPLTFDEASRVICNLKRGQTAFPDLVEKITEADRAGDGERLGRLLADAKCRMQHGDWLTTLRELRIHPRRAQRAIKAAALTGGT